MRFIERLFMGIGYHWRPYLLTGLTAVLFTVGGLFCQTNLMIENLAKNSFTHHLSEFNTVTNTAHRAILQITNAHTHQQDRYTAWFWLVLTLFAAFTMLIAWRLERPRSQELRAYLQAGISARNVASQNALAAALSFLTGFTLTTLVSLLHPSIFSRLIAQFNRHTFTHALTSSSNTSIPQLKRALSHLFDGHITDFNVHSLIYGRGSAEQLLNTLGGYSLILAFGTTIVIIVHFASCYRQARRLKRSLTH